MDRQPAEARRGCSFTSWSSLLASYSTIQLHCTASQNPIGDRSDKSDKRERKHPVQICTKYLQLGLQEVRSVWKGKGTTSWLG